MAGGEGKGSISYLSMYPPVVSGGEERRGDKSRQGIESAEQVIIRETNQPKRQAALPFRKTQELSAEINPDDRGGATTSQVLLQLGRRLPPPPPRQTGSRGQENPACSPTTTGSWTSICPDSLPFSLSSLCLKHTTARRQLASSVVGMAGWRKRIRRSKESKPLSFQDGGGFGLAGGSTVPLAAPLGGRDGWEAGGAEGSDSWPWAACRAGWLLRGRKSCCGRGRRSVCLSSRERVAIKL